MPLDTCALQEVYSTLNLHQFIEFLHLLASGVGVHWRSGRPPSRPLRTSRLGGWRAFCRMIHSWVGRRFRSRRADNRRTPSSSVREKNSIRDLWLWWRNNRTISSRRLASAAPSFESHPVIKTALPAVVTFLERGWKGFYYYLLWRRRAAFVFSFIECLGQASFNKRVIFGESEQRRAHPFGTRRGKNRSPRECYELAPRSLNETANWWRKMRLLGLKARFNWNAVSYGTSVLLFTAPKAHQQMLVLSGF